MYLIVRYYYLNGVYFYQKDFILQKHKVDPERRQFLAILTGLIAAIGACFAAIPFISAWKPSARAKAAGAPVEADISHLQPGERMVVSWRGKPVWIIRRTDNMLRALNQHNDKLRDPLSKIEQQPDYAGNPYRSIHPEYLVLIGICTHLGCSPNYVPGIGELGPNWPGGFYCPCHGSTFDLAGRVFEGVPAPINLEVPPYKFVSKTKLLIGEDDNRGNA